MRGPSGATAAFGHAFELQTIMVDSELIETVCIENEQSTKRFAK